MYTNKTVLTETVYNWCSIDAKCRQPRPPNLEQNVYCRRGTVMVDWCMEYLVGSLEF